MESAIYRGHFVRNKLPSITEFKGELRDSQNDDGTISGYNFGWLSFDERTFSDVLSEWIGKYKNADDFIKDIGLSGEIKKKDLSDLIAGTKTPSKELTNYLSVKVPSDVCSWLKLINRGKAIAKSDAEQVTISDKSMRQSRTQKIREIVSNPSVKEDNGFVEWLTENINDVAIRYKKPVDVEKSIAGIAAVLDVSVNQLKGIDKIPPNVMHEKAEKLAGLFMHGEKDFDVAVEKATSAWSGTKTDKEAPAYSRIVSYLRQSAGMKQTEFSKSTGIQLLRIERLESGVAIEKDGINDKIFKQFDLTKEDKKLIADSYKEYKEIVKEKFYEHCAPVIEHFAKYGLTRENYLKAATGAGQLFYNKPEKIIANIEGVYNHFKDKGLKLEDYLKAAVARPELFCHKPKTIIANIEGVHNHFKDRGLKLEDYLKAAVIQPTLFYQKPKTIIEHMELIIDMYQKELLAFYPKGTRPNDFKPEKPVPNDLSPLFNYLTTAPTILTNSTDNIKSRTLAAALEKHNNGGEIPSTKNISSPKPVIMDKLLGYLNQDDDRKETPNSFVRKELLKPKKPAEAEKSEDIKWVKRLKSTPSQEKIYPSP